MKNRIKGSIALKTFIFTSILIVSVVAASLAFLCLALPEYYMRAKLKTISYNSEKLATELAAVNDDEEARRRISEFVSENNANVIALSGQGHFIPQLSSPLVSIEDSAGMKIKLNIRTDNAVEEADELPKATESRSSSLVKIERETQGRAEESVAFDVEEGKMAETFYVTFSSASDDGSIEIAYSDDIFFKNYHIGSEHIDSLAISSTFQPIGEATVVIMELAPYILLLCACIALIASYIYSKRFTAPILKISDAAIKMSRMEPDALSGVKSNDELGKLSGNLDSMYVELLLGMESLKEEMEKVNRLEKSKTDFMRAAGHELKTPISALMGITEGMLDGVGVYKDKEKYLNESKKLIGKLSLMVTEILNASKADRTDEAAAKSEVSLDDIINEVLVNFQTVIDEKLLTVSITGGGLETLSQYDLLYYSISNIISNAINYTPCGGTIIISTSQAGVERIFSVENSAENIPEELLPRLFEPFYTLEYSRDKNKSGTGLGLYIVKNNLEKLDHDYKIENTEEGIKFSIFF